MKPKLTLLTIVGLLALSTGLLAQDAATKPASTAAAAPAPAPAKPVLLGEGKGTVTLTWDEFVKITGYDPAQKADQVLTIPWKDVKQLLGPDIKVDVRMDSTMVDLPWSDFKALLDWTIKKKTEDETPPPTDFIVTSCQFEGNIAGDEAAFTLKAKLNILRKTGWKRIPVLSSAVALTETTLPPEFFLNANGNAYELLTEKSGPADITLKFAVTMSKNAGINSIAFDRVLPGSATLDLTIDGAQVDAKVAAAQAFTSKVVDTKTKVGAALAAGQNVAFTWEKALPKVAAAPTKIYAETRTLAAVAEGLFVCQESADFNILHTAVRELRMTVPDGVSVLDVAGAAVDTWRADKGLLTVLLKQEVIGPYNLRVSYEAPISGKAAEAPAEPVMIPVLRPAPADAAGKWAGVEREKGYVGVIALANLEIAAGKVEGCSTVDVKQLPAEIAAMTRQPILLGFRYVADKFTIPLLIKRHGEISVLVTVVDSALYTVMQLDDGRRMTRAIYTVRNNRNQFLRVTMPLGAEIWSASVSGNTVSPGVDEKKNILIPLVRSDAGASELASFPVEIVYVETPREKVPAAGKLHVTLPQLDAPTMHVMASYYAPPEGRYGKPGGLFGGGSSGFSGSMRLVTDFASMTTDKGTAVVAQDAQKTAQQMTAQFDAKMEQEAKAAGAAPIRVRLPIEGKVFKLEKVLALSGDDLFFDVEYSEWKPAQ